MKKILGLALAMVMTFGLLQTAAFAEDEKVITTIKKGQYIQFEDRLWQKIGDDGSYFLLSEHSGMADGYDGTRNLSKSKLMSAVLIPFIEGFSQKTWLDVHKWEVGYETNEAELTYEGRISGIGYKEYNEAKSYIAPIKERWYLRTGCSAGLQTIGVWTVMPDTGELVPVQGFGAPTYSRAYIKLNENLLIAEGTGTEEEPYILKSKVTDLDVTVDGNLVKVVPATIAGRDIVGEIDITVDGETVGAAKCEFDRRFEDSLPEAVYELTDIEGEHKIGASFKGDDYYYGGVTKEITATVIKPEKPVKKMVLTLNKREIQTEKGAKFIDASNKSVTPILDGSRTILPIRAVVEEMGGTITWDGSKDEVGIRLHDIVITLAINAKEASVNGEIKELDVPAQIIEGRTMVPLRFVAENLGCNVVWNGEKEEITIEF